MGKNNPKVFGFFNRLNNLAKLKASNISTSSFNTEILPLSLFKVPFDLFLFSQEGNNFATLVPR